MRTLSVANTGSGIVDLEFDHPSQNHKIRLGPHGIKTISPAPPLRLGDAKVYINKAGQLEVANVGAELVRIAYTNSAGEPKTMMLGEDATGYFGGANTIAIGDAKVSVAE